MLPSRVEKLKMASAVTWHSFLIGYVQYPCGVRSQVVLYFYQLNYEQLSNDELLKLCSLLLCINFCYQTIWWPQCNWLRVVQVLQNTELRSTYTWNLYGYIHFVYADTMMKFASFENTVEMIYKYSIPTPKEQCSRSLQVGVSIVGGYIAGVFCAIVSHPADNLVSFLNNAKGATVTDVSLCVAAS